MAVLLLMLADDRDEYDDDDDGYCCGCCLMPLLPLRNPIPAEDDARTLTSSSILCMMNITAITNMPMKHSRDHVDMYICLTDVVSTRGWDGGGGGGCAEAESA